MIETPEVDYLQKISIAEPDGPWIFLGTIVLDKEVNVHIMCSTSYLLKHNCVRIEVLEINPKTLDLYSCTEVINSKTNLYNRDYIEKNKLQQFFKESGKTIEIDQLNKLFAKPSPPELDNKG